MNKKSLNWSLRIASFIAAFVFAGLIWNAESGDNVIWYYLGTWIAINALIFFVRYKYIIPNSKS
jgi:hypothetical protein